MPSPLRKLVQPFLSQEPAELLIRQTARQQWRLIGLNLASSLGQAFTEGATLATIFLAIKVLSASNDASFDLQSIPLLRGAPAIANWLNGLSPTVFFTFLLGLALVLQALQSFSAFLGLVSMGYFAARCRTLVMSRINSQVLSFSFPCASGYKIGDLIEYANSGPEAIRVHLDNISQVLLNLLLIVTYLSVLVSISPWLLLAVALITGLIALVQKQLVPRITDGSHSLSRAMVAVSSRMTEDFQGLRLLHSSGQLDEADKQLRSGMGELERLMRAQARRLAVVMPFTTFLPILAIVLIAGMSVLLLGNTNNGVFPSLITFVLALQRLNGRLSNLASISNNLADNRGRIGRLNKILSPKGKVFRRLGGIPFYRLNQSIRFEDVSLVYSTDLPPAIQSISFTLPKGQMIALVGASGAGKSSIADLLTGLYTPSSGQIWIDSTPLNQLELSSWQKRLGVVSQDTFLFNASIGENIAFGTPGATHNQIQAACQAAQAASFIESLSDGYDTVVGERGYRLSGGQRQRLSLARAILRDPELLILDEATSALDSQSERLVQEAIERFERTHTVLVIAHRLSTIVRADHILVLDAGRVVEQGNHETLLSQQCIYSQLWHQQSHNHRFHPN